MNKTMIDKLLNSISHSTKSGSLNWKLRSSCFNSETVSSYECELGDGTKIRVEINLDDNLNFHHGGTLWILNPKLVNGQILVTSYEHKDIINSLTKLVFEKFVKPTITPKVGRKSQEDILGDIINSISIEDTRDRKIDEIIDTPKKKFFNLF